MRPSPRPLAPHAGRPAPGLTPPYVLPHPPLTPARALSSSSSREQEGDSHHAVDKQLEGSCAVFVLTMDPRNQVTHSSQPRPAPESGEAA